MLNKIFQIVQNDSSLHLILLILNESTISILMLSLILLIKLNIYCSIIHIEQIVHLILRTLIILLEHFLGENINYQLEK